MIDDLDSLPTLANRIWIGTCGALRFGPEAPLCISGIANQYDPRYEELATQNHAS